MAIIYTCRHCKHVIGQIRHQVISTSILRWQKLSASERQKMIQYKANGDVLIWVICKNCEQTLMDNPDYHALEYFIH